MSLFPRMDDYENAKFPPLRPFQVTAHEALREAAREGHRQILIMAPTGGGKCLGYDTPVLMADGRIVPVQDVRTGDQLMGPDGQPRNVLSTTTGQELLYRVTPMKGDPYVVNASHILSLIDGQGDVQNMGVREYLLMHYELRMTFSGWRVPGVMAGDLRIALDPIEVEALQDGDYYGFEIDGDRLFLLGDFTVTHNTMMAHNIAHEALIRQKRVTFVCDRTTLINQTSASADKLGLTQHAIVQANHWRRDPSLRYQIASAQTLAKRGYWPQSDVILVDEAHTQLKVWTDHIAKAPAISVGLSATPFTPGLGKHFTKLINAATMHELTQQGILVPMRVFSCKRADMTGAKTSGGEWTPNAAAERGMEIIGDVVQEWLNHAEGRKTIVFGATIKHCQELAARFVDAGVMAAVFTSETTDAERKMLLAEYSKPDSALRVLISVEALAKGFDVPDVGCVVDCRPLRKSLSTAIQMWGRGLRSSPGKTDLILLDHSGNIVRMAEDFERIYFNGLDKLDDGEKLDKTIRKDEVSAEPKGCPVCSFKPFAARCMSCGFEIVKPSGVEALPGTMQEMAIGVNREQLWAEICSHAKATKGMGEWFAKEQYRKMTGANPPCSFAGAQVVDVPADLAKKMRGEQLRRIIANKARRKFA